MFSAFENFCQLGGLFEPESSGGNTPTNAYVAEDGVTFYVAEDGITFYVQES